MYVDKPLGGVIAVQTLSRLNRAHPKKRDTFVLDFADNKTAVELAFQDYYRATIQSGDGALVSRAAADRVISGFPDPSFGNLRRLAAASKAGAAAGDTAGAPSFDLITSCRLMRPSG